MGTSDGPARGEPSLGSGRANLLRFGGGLLISVLLLVLLFSNIDAEQMAASWERVSLLGALAAVVIHGLSLALRVRRWRGLLEVSDCAPGAESSPKLVWDSAFFGWLVNLVLPARVGELARPLMYAGGSGRPFPRVLGTSLIERAADLATVALLGLAALTLLPGSELLPPWLPQVVWGGAAVASACLLLAGIVARRSAVPSAVRSSRLFEAVARLREGFASLHQPRAILRLSAESLGIWLLEVASVWIVLVTFGHPAPLNLAFVHVVAVTLMVSVVTLPFGLGVEQGTTVGLLRFWDISRPDALALSLVLTFSALAWVIPGGLWAWWRQGARLGRR
jgi:uncharacterized membrane protein YbhN (UPF0104 family)